MSERKDLPAEGIQVAPVFAEKLTDLNRREVAIKEFDA